MVNGLDVLDVPLEILPDVLSVNVSSASVMFWLDYRPVALITRLSTDR